MQERDKMLSSPKCNLVQFCQTVQEKAYRGRSQGRYSCGNRWGTASVCERCTAQVVKCRISVFKVDIRETDSNIPNLLSAEFDRQQSAGSRKILPLAMQSETVKMLVEKIAPNDPYSAATWDRARKSQAHLLYVLDVNHKSDVDSLCLLEKYDAHAGQQCCVVGPNFDASSSLATEARARVSGGVHAGDIILSLNGRKMLSLDDLVQANFTSRNVMAFGRRTEASDISHFKSRLCSTKKNEEEGIAPIPGTARKTNAV